MIINNVWLCFNIICCNKFIIWLLFKVFNDVIGLFVIINLGFNMRMFVMYMCLSRFLESWKLYLFNIFLFCKLIYDKVLLILDKVFFLLFL